MYAIRSYYAAQTALLMGEAYAARGDTAEAIASFRAAIARDSMFARGVAPRLRALGVESYNFV